MLAYSGILGPIGVRCKLIYTDGKRFSPRFWTGSWVYVHRNNGFIIADLNRWLLLPNARVPFFRAVNVEHRLDERFITGDNLPLSEVDLNPMFRVIKQL